MTFLEGKWYSNGKSNEEFDFHDEKDHELQFIVASRQFQRDAEV